MLDNLLAQLHEIHPLSDALTAYLRSILVTHQLPKKTLLLKKGEVCDQVYFIEKGMLHCYYEKNDAKITSWFMKENDVIISAKSFFLQQPSEENIITLEESIVHGISFEQLHDIYERFPEFNVIGRVLTTRYYIQSEERLYSLRKERAKDRYDHLVQSHPDFLLRAPLQHIASYLGISLETLSRIRSSYG